MCINPIDCDSLDRDRGLQLQPSWGMNDQGCDDFSASMLQAF